MGRNSLIDFVLPFTPVRCLLFVLFHIRSHWPSYCADYIPSIDMILFVSSISALCTQFVYFFRVFLGDLSFYVGAKSLLFLYGY